MGQSEADEDARVAAVAGYRLVGAPRLTVLDELTELATAVFHTRTSTVTLVDRELQWFAGKTGMDGDGGTREFSFCSRVVESGRTLIVHDAAVHPEYAHYGNVTGGPFIRLYAGVPLVDQAGYTLGAVCVIDSKPGDVGDRGVDTLDRLARQAAGHLSAVRSRMMLASLGEELARVASREQDLVATVSHELRTPVASIQGYLEMLTEDEALASYRRFLEPIRRNGDRLVRMVDHLLAGTRPTGDTYELAREPVDLAAAASAATAAVEAQARHRDVKCLVEMSGTPSPVPGDLTRLVQALEQVIGNAVLFSRPGSAVRVLVTYSGNAATVQVVDEGVGIPPRELPYVLERFYRGRHAREDAVAGVGLGLTIAHDIVTAHGGSLTVTSGGTGRGTTVRMSLRS